MIKKHKIPNRVVSDFVIGFYIYGFVSDFDFWISDFILAVSWRDNFVEVVLFTISKVRI